MIEGTDGSGKATQAKMLEKTLAKNFPVKLFEFPRYTRSEFGRLIGRSLAGEFGDFLNLSPYLSSLPYIIDRVRAKDLLVEYLKEGFVICDRYTPSNLVYQSAKLPESQRQAFIDFIEKGEYEELGLPSPDLVIFLRVPPNISARLISKKKPRAYLKGKSKDQHEESLGYQTEVQKVYNRMAKTRPEWRVVDCYKKGELLSKKQIEVLVLREVKRAFKI